MHSASRSDAWNSPGSRFGKKTSRAAASAVAMLPVVTTGAAGYSSSAGPSTALIADRRATATGACSSYGSVLSLPRGEECSLPWEELRKLLRPTQPMVGYAWVQNMLLFDFKTPESAQRALDKEPVPVACAHDRSVEDGGRRLFLVDHHHLMAALDLSGFNLRVTVRTICVLTDAVTGHGEAGIWAELFRRGWAFPHSIPALTASNFTGIPSAAAAARAMPRVLHFTAANQSLGDDPWRSLAGFSRKLDPAKLAKLLGSDASCPAANRWCMRAYDSPCAPNNTSIPFLEFRWAYFFSHAHRAAAALWPSGASAAAFAQRFDALPAVRLSPPDSSGGAAAAVGLSAWSEAAAALVPLARHPATGAYELPAELGPHAGRLPGFRAGMGRFEEEEPECEPVGCNEGV